jgi:hypothetical protein
MTLAIIGDRSTSATRPHILQSSVDNAENKILSSTTCCGKRKDAESMQDSLPAGKSLHSQTARTLPSAFNEQLTSNEASKDSSSINKRKRNKCSYDKSKVSQVSGILEKLFRRKAVQEPTSNNAQLTKSSYNRDLHYLQNLPDLTPAIRPYPPTPLNYSTSARRITVRDKRILKRLAAAGCNTLTRRSQKHRDAMS